MKMANGNWQQQLDFNRSLTSFSTRPADAQSVGKREKEKKTFAFFMPSLLLLSQLNF